MMFQGSLNLLLRAERKLGIEGLVLLLQCDGSGCIRRFDESYVFKFDRLDELKAWLRSPRVVEYDEEGPVQRRTGNAGRKTVKPGGLSQ